MLFFSCRSFLFNVVVVSQAQKSSSSFPKTLRMRTRSDFFLLNKRKRTFVSTKAPSVSIEWMLTSNPSPRLGITVTRKQGMSVDRNLFRRRVREAFRLSILRGRELGVDIHVRPRLKNMKGGHDLALRDISFKSVSEAFHDFTLYIDTVKKRSMLPNPPSD